MNFSQGYLSKVNVLYYAIEKTVYFYDAASLIENEQDINETLIGHYEMEDILYEIKEVELSSKLILPNLQH